jgi:YD repeat-containing protein
MKGENDMKRFVLIQALLCISLFAIAQKECKVLSQEVGSIKFEVDKDLPAPKQRITMLESDKVAIQVLDNFQIDKSQTNVLACSFADKPLWYRGKEVLWQTLVNAYADHRPVKLTPDVVWEHICLTFSEYVNNHAEEMRPFLVDHEGVKDLVVKTDLRVDPTLDVLHHKNANWKEVIRLFSQEIAKHTKGDLAETITADFSTTGLTELIASQVTLMDAVKQYFRYINFAASCGIPYIVLEGTPADWQKLMEKAQALEKYNMKWWTQELLPILKEFVKTAEGNPSSKFWKDIVMKDRPDRLRGGGCSNEPPTKFDGWMLKLFPNTKTQTIPEEASSNGSLGPELSHVGFKYVEYDPITNVILEEADIELIAGFVGIEVDEQTGMLSPKIGWIARKADVDGETLARIIEQQHGMPLTVDEVPTALKRAKQLDRLYLKFLNKDVVIPEWMDSIEIKNFKIEGRMSDDVEAQLKQRFPNATVISATKRDAQRAKQEAERAARKAKLAPILAKYSQRLDSITLHGAGYDGVRKYTFEYDDVGYMTTSTCINYSKSGVKLNPVQKSVSRLDTLGREMWREKYDWDNEAWQLTSKVVKTYNEAGKIVSSIVHPEGQSSLIRSEERYYYDTAGRLDSTVYVRHSKLSSYHLRTSYQYDRKGLLKEAWEYANGELESITHYKYDGAKRLIEITHDDGIRGKEETLYTYDKQGLRTGMTNLHPYNAQKEFCLYDPDGDKTTVYEKNYYDDDDPDWRKKLSFSDGEYERTTAFFYRKDTKVTNVMGLETWLKGYVDLLPYSNRYGISKHIPTQIVETNDYATEVKVSTFYYSYIY